jgi:hypothetical protein
MVVELSQENTRKYAIFQDRFMCDFNSDWPKIGHKKGSFGTIAQRKQIQSE